MIQQEIVFTLPPSKKKKNLLKQESVGVSLILMFSAPLSPNALSPSLLEK